MIVLGKVKTTFYLQIVQGFLDSVIGIARAAELEELQKKFIFL